MSAIPATGNQTVYVSTGEDKASEPKNSTEALYEKLLQACYNAELTLSGKSDEANEKAAIGSKLVNLIGMTDQVEGWATALDGFSQFDSFVTNLKSQLSSYIKTNSTDAKASIVQLAKEKQEADVFYAEKLQTYSQKQNDYDYWSGLYYTWSNSADDWASAPAAYAMMETLAPEVQQAEIAKNDYYRDVVTPKTQSYNNSITSYSQHAGEAQRAQNLLDTLNRSSANELDKFNQIAGFFSYSDSQSAFSSLYTTYQGSLAPTFSQTIVASSENGVFAGRDFLAGAIVARIDETSSGFINTAQMSLIETAQQLVGNKDDYYRQISSMPITVVTRTYAPDKMATVNAALSSWLSGISDPDSIISVAQHRISLLQSHNAPSLEGQLSQAQTVLDWATTVLKPNAASQRDVDLVQSQRNAALLSLNEARSNLSDLTSTDTAKQIAAINYFLSDPTIRNANPALVSQLSNLGDGTFVKAATGDGSAESTLLRQIQNMANDCGVYVTIDSPTALAQAKEALESQLQLANQDQEAVKIDLQKVIQWYQLTYQLASQIFGLVGNMGHRVISSI